MKIEKVNENQIRCTLTKSDLAQRQLKISELAYGTEKAKNLFRDMMQQASYQFGFEAEDIPLMIEAIPLAGDTIVLIITKVEDPEELDTRFSKFAPSLRANDSSMSNDISHSSADDILDMFRKMKQDMQDKGKAALPASDSTLKQIPMQTNASEVEISVPVEITKLYSFDDLEGVAQLAHIINGFYDGENSLYHLPSDDRYYLVVRKSSHTPEQFNKVCNIITEYSDCEHYTKAEEALLCEHGELILKESALQQMALI